LKEPLEPMSADTRRRLDGFTVARSIRGPRVGFRLGPRFARSVLSCTHFMHRHFLGDIYGQLNLKSSAGPGCPKPAAFPDRVWRPREMAKPVERSQYGQRPPDFSGHGRACRPSGARRTCLPGRRGSESCDSSLLLGDGGPHRLME